MENDEENVFLEDNNHNDNDSYSTVTTTTQMEEGTIMRPNTAPTDEGKDVGLGKTNKDKEELEHNGEEDKDGSINKNIVSDENQEIYFNNGTEKVTNMGTDTGTTNVGVLLKGDKNTEGPDGKAGEKQNQI